MSERTLRWRGGVAATILLAVAGLAEQDGTLLLSAMIPLGYVAYGMLSSVEVPEELVAERTIAPTPAAPGQPVRMTLTVSNESNRTLSDFRVVDDVPEALAVMKGTPRAGMPLGPRETCTVEYVVVARRGTHGFGRPRLRLRGPGAGAVATTELDERGDVELVCRLDADAPPIGDTGNTFVGRLTDDQPGEGIEFHSTREYRVGDPASRIDWRQYAKHGTLATVNYERQVSATVVLVLDAREANRVVAGPGRPTAVELSAYAATQAMTDLLRGGHDVAAAVIGLDGPGPAALHWLPASSGSDQRVRALDLFRAGADGDTDAPDVEAQAQKIAALTSPGAQIVLVSPLLDEKPVSAVETWRASDYQQVVLSPDVLSGNTVSGQFEQVRRRTRLARCQALGARTIDWRRGTPLALVVDYAFAADARLGNSIAGGDD